MTDTCEISDLEIDKIEAAWERDYLQSSAGTGDPTTDQQLWRYIKYAAGGIGRSRDYWSDRLSTLENRRAFRYLDRAGEGQGRHIDELAQEIGMVWPWYGINDGHDLFDWMQRTRRC